MPSTEMRRCPACGASLTIQPLPPGARWVLPCPVCGHSVEALGARDSPPLFHWELTPSLYARRRLSRLRARPVALAALGVGAAVVLAAFAACAVLLGLALQPATYGVSGTVVQENAAGAWIPVAGAQVTLTMDGGGHRTTVTDGQGSFRFGGVPAGFIGLNVTHPGDRASVWQGFAAPGFPASPLAGLEIPLLAGSASNETPVAVAPFSSLTVYAASLGAAATLSLVAGALALAAVWALARQGRPVPGVIAAAALVGVPIALSMLTVTSVSLAVAIPAIAGAAAGVVGLAGAAALTADRTATEGISP